MVAEHLHKFQPSPPSGPPGGSCVVSYEFSENISLARVLRGLRARIESETREDFRGLARLSWDLCSRGSSLV